MLRIQYLAKVVNAFPMAEEWSIKSIILYVQEIGMVLRELILNIFQGRRITLLIPFSYLIKIFSIEKN